MKGLILALLVVMISFVGFSVATAGDTYFSQALLAPTTAYTGSNWCTGVYVCNQSTTTLILTIRDSNTIKADFMIYASSHTFVELNGVGHITNSTSTVFKFNKNEATCSGTIFYRER